MPSNSTLNCSIFVPWKTVFPYPFMPGRTSSTDMNFALCAERFTENAARRIREKETRWRVLLFMVDRNGPFLNTMFSIRKTTTHSKLMSDLVSTPWPVTGFVLAQKHPDRLRQGESGMGGLLLQHVVESLQASPTGSTWQSATNCPIAFPASYPIRNCYRARIQFDGRQSDHRRRRSEEHT